MAQKNRCYKVDAIGSGYGKSYPLREVRPGTTVKAMEYCSKHTLDVIDVKLKNGQIKNVYSFQLDDMVACPRELRK